MVVKPECETVPDESRLIVDRVCSEADDDETEFEDTVVNEVRNHNLMTGAKHSLPCNLETSHSRLEGSMHSSVKPKPEVSTLETFSMLSPAAASSAVCSDSSPHTAAESRLETSVSGTGIGGAAGW